MSYQEAGPVTAASTYPAHNICQAVHINACPGYGGLILINSSASEGLNVHTPAKEARSSWATATSRQPAGSARRVFLAVIGYAAICALDEHAKHTAEQLHSSSLIVGLEYGSTVPGGRGISYYSYQASWRAELACISLTRLFLYRWNVSYLIVRRQE
jgi:hypothetical protein